MRYLFLAGLFIAGCVAAEKPVEPDLKPVIRYQADWDGKPDGATWTALTMQAMSDLGGALLTANVSDVADFCPAYPQMTSEAQKSAFWVGLISAMARLESGHDPSVSYQENFKTSDGRWVISRGLLQLSQESANAYRGCSVPRDNEALLHDAEVNLRCGVIILSRWVGADGQIADTEAPWRGGARYWSVLRVPARISAIKAYTRGMTVCGG